VIDPPLTDDERELSHKLAFLWPDSMLARSRWMQSPNPMLGGERPSACWLAGRTEDVLQVLEMLETGAYG